MKLIQQINLPKIDTTIKNFTIMRFKYHNLNNVTIIYSINPNGYIQESVVDFY